MKKQSAMGSSKYEFNPVQFDIDMTVNQFKYKIKKDNIKNTLKELIIQDIEHKENYNLIIECMLELKSEINL